MNEIKDTIHVAFVGNPNCGKTTLFNALTGSSLKVANWAGVTVEKVEGEVTYEDKQLLLVDTPGIYSLTSYTIEEKVTRNCVMDDDIEVIVNVVDASCMERNLYLTLQLLELGKPVVLALNMMDIVEERGMEIDLHRLPEILGDIPVVPVSAAKRKGFDILLHAVVHHYEEGSKGNIITYCSENEKERIQARYTFIENLMKEVLFYHKRRKDSTDKADRILTHPIWGVPIFLCIMAFVFFLTFTVGDWLKGYLEIFVDFIGNQIYRFLDFLHASQWLKSLIVDGIIAGVGGILTFIPNIAVLFLALAILEDSGYMSRVAYVMDNIMGKVGLSGKAFLPMILGFGCTVPAIMASRALESEKDRRRVMIITPFMSCSARLPVYILFSGMFFGKYAHWIAFSMYVVGMLLAVLVAKLMHFFDKAKENDSLLIELPEYKRPNTRTIRIYVWNKLKDYLSKAGTTIFVASIIIWAVLNFGMHGIVSNPADSIGAMLGKLLEPVMAPAGLGIWQVIVSLIAGVSAKEIVVSCFYVLFDGNMQSIVPSFGPLNAYCMMLFVLLYMPCVAAIATIRKESGSLIFTTKLVMFQIGFAWLISTIVFQIGSLFL